RVATSSPLRVTRAINCNSSIPLASGTEKPHTHAIARLQCQPKRNVPRCVHSMLSWTHLLRCLNADPRPGGGMTFSRHHDFARTPQSTRCGADLRNCPKP